MIKVETKVTVTIKGEQVELDKQEALSLRDELNGAFPQQMKLPTAVKYPPTFVGQHDYRTPTSTPPPQVIWCSQLYK